MAGVKKADKVVNERKYITAAKKFAPISRKICSFLAGRVKLGFSDKLCFNTSTSKTKAS